MPPRKKTSGPMPIEAYAHADTRTNIPTADAHDFVGPDIDEPVPVTYPRELRSPMLVWQGKESLDDTNLEVDAPPIYIQEKIDPRIIVEHLRETSKANDPEPELTLFDTFDGLSELDRLEFYKHPAAWANRMILGDSLQAMASLAERERLRGKVQMIYIDPPYGIEFSSNWQVSTRKRDVKDGRIEDIAREAEQIKAFRDTWQYGINSYLSYLRDRLQTARELLTPNGSVFLQISDDNVHLVRSLMDEVFGPENSHPPIIFRKKMMPMMREPGFESTFDYILWYQRNRGLGGVKSLFTEKSYEGDSGWSWLDLPDGTRRRLTSQERSDHSRLPAGARVFQPISMLPRQYRKNQDFVFHLDGQPYPPPKGVCWSTTHAGMKQLALAGRLHPSGADGLRYVYFADDYPVGRLTAAWMDASPATDQRYVVETNGRVVQRCMLATTSPGDLVLDPTCGSGTTAYVAEQWGRRWITIDTSRVALALARQRLMGARFPYYLLADSVEGRRKESELSATSLPPATPKGDIHQGFVYERVQHITLKSIANNPDIKEGMSREEIDKAIKRHADFELLYDKPFEDKRTARVAGPFTVESLSPHRNLAGLDAREEQTVQRAANNADAPTFEQTVLDNLRVAGIQNGKRAERLTFEVVETYAGTHIQALGIREDAPDGAPRRVGVSIGPQYGTVAPRFVKDAAREASRARDLDLLCILGFAFEPQVLDNDDEYAATDEGFDVAAERALGRIPVLMVRMNADLLMGEELKKTGAGNLFTVFGEPDIAVTVDGDEARVELQGIDVYDPTTGVVRSDGTDRVALWMIDTDYDGDSFYVRHCYFTGGQDPYKRLKNTLKSEIDPDAWATLYRTESRPFPLPSSGRIAVKVINDYGDEVMTVYEVPAP
jgi:adenine-specific DNA-methyltransferase